MSNGVVLDEYEKALFRMLYTEIMKQQRSLREIPPAGNNKVLAVSKAQVRRSFEKFGVKVSEG